MPKLPDNPLKDSRKHVAAASQRSREGSYNLLTSATPYPTSSRQLNPNAREGPVHTIVVMQRVLIRSQLPALEPDAVRLHSLRRTYRGSFMHAMPLSLRMSPNPPSIRLAEIES